MSIKELSEMIARDSLIKKHVYKGTWISGSSTEVYPITVWRSDITVQLQTKRNLFRACIKRIVSASGGLLEDGYFSRGDGSCPARLVFLLKKSRYK